MLAVIVINFGSPELTIRFVKEECVKIQEDHRVIVVDNASTDATYDALQTALPEAVVLRSQENQGFARANNQGARYAIRHFRPEYFLFSNNDIYFRDSQVADVLIEQMKIHPEAGLMGPQVIGPDGKRQSPSRNRTFAESFLLPTWGRLVYRKETLQKRLQVDYKQNAQEGPCDWVQGSCFLADAAVFEQVGGFDPATFLYGEELILTARFARAGKSVRFCPQVTVLHDQGAVCRKHFAEVQMRRMEFRSLAYYYREYAGTPWWQIVLGRLTLELNVLRGK